MIDPTNAAKASYPIVICAGVIGGIIWLAAANAPDPSTAPVAKIEAPAPTCKTDWTLCADNADMANNFGGWSQAQVHCKIAATDAAKYGTPEFHWPFYFGSFRRGDDYRSGTVTVIDDDGQYSNGFGAIVHARTTCTYDLRQKRVVDIKIEGSR